MTTGKIVCQVKKHLVPVEEAVVTRCRDGCSFRAVACLEHGGLGFTVQALHDHVVAVKEHGTDKVLEQCIDALQKAHLGIAELIVCGCTSDADMEVEMTAIRDALDAVGKPYIAPRKPK